MKNYSTNVEEILLKFGIEIVHISRSEIITKCFKCHNSSKSKKPRLYFKKQTGQYYCHNCGIKGNLITLAKELNKSIDISCLPVSSIDTKQENTNKAKYIWETSFCADKTFPYLARKKIQPSIARIYKGSLVIPLYNEKDELSSLQFIDTNGKKKFLTGGKTVGCFAIIGRPENTICIAEGFATAFSIYEATGYATVIAFSSNNLEKVTETIQRKYQNYEIILCGDTDKDGKLKVEKIAYKLEIKLALPVFNNDELLDGKTPTDFNDLAVISGVKKVKEIISFAEKPKHKSSFTSLADLFETPDQEVEWIVEDLLPSGGFSLLIAKPKAGKSTLVRQLALAISRGIPFLGRKTYSGLTLYIALEEKESEVKNHFKLMGATGNEQLGVYVGITPEESIFWLKNEIINSKPVLVIIDTLFRFVSITDINDYAKVTKALDPILAIARENNVHILGLHHGSKRGGEDGDGTLGSTAIFGSADTQITLIKKGDQRTIETRQRYGVDLEKTILNFNPSTKSFNVGLTTKEDNLKRVENDILELLNTTKKILLEEEIAEEVTSDTSTKRKALRQLCEQGRINRAGTGKRGDPYKYACLLVSPICVEQAKQEIVTDLESVNQVSVGVVN